MSAVNFSKLHTLDTFLFPYTELNDVWKCDPRYGIDVIQRFISLNRRSFDFLKIVAGVELIGNVPYLRLQTSQFAGSIPLLSPKDGKPYRDLGIGGRYGEDISELLSIVGDTFLPEYNGLLPSLSSSLLEPPLYFECCNFIDKWIDVERAHWNKFDVVDRIERAPNSGTRWNLYALRSYEPENILKFPNRTNKLQPFHKEFREMISVLWQCFNELKKPQVPMRSRLAYNDKVIRLQVKYPESMALPVSADFIKHTNDPIPVKEAKRIANIIIQNKRTDKRAWRIDYSKFFERYVQYLFGEVAKKSNAKSICNPHYSVLGKKSAWALSYLEPDLILQKEDDQHVIDAKYKSHMFNWNDNSEELKETFRHDLHQILAYCSFNTMATKKALLVYPFGDFAYHQLKIQSPLSKANAEVYLVGIPLVKNEIENVKEKLNGLINN